MSGKRRHYMLRMTPVECPLTLRDLIDKLEDLYLTAPESIRDEIQVHLDPAGLDGVSGSLDAWYELPVEAGNVELPPQVR